MTDKMQKIHEEIKMIVNRRLNLLNGDYFDLNKEVDGFTNEIMDIVNSLQEEPVSEDLENYINNLSKQFPEVSFAKLSRIAVRAAKWQEKQDKSTIELAEDHAMLAGMNKMEEQMMEKAVETTFNVSLPSSLYDKLWIKGCKEGDKLLVIKKDEL